MPSPPESGSPEEALRRLEQRLDRASEAAERLMAQAAAEAAARATEAVIAGAGAEAARRSRSGRRGRSGRPGDPGGAGDPANSPPPAGWQIPRDDSAPPLPDLDPLVALVQAMRDLIPPELQHRLTAALRELLLALRALIDWYLERLEHRREQGVEVQDIPIL